MWGVVCALALAVLPPAEAAAEPLTVAVTRSTDELIIDFALAAELPEDMVAAVSSGAPVQVDYLLRVYSPRKLLPDRRVFKGVARSAVTFDAITGRYICQLIVNEDTVASCEAESLAAARSWLRAPPPIEVMLPEARQDEEVRVRVRAVFARGTTWLVFPTTDGTSWVEVALPATAPDPGE